MAIKGYNQINIRRNCLKDMNIKEKLGDKRKAIYISLTIFAFFVLIWAILFNFGQSFVQIAPSRETVISDPAPIVSVKCLAPFTKLELLSFKLDGKNFTSSVSSDSRSFNYPSPQKFFEGEHIVEVNLLYKCLFSKKLKLKWSFVVDTVAPEVTFENFDGTIATPVSRVNLKGKTEPNIEIKALLNGNEISFEGVDSKGDFAFNIWRLPEEENELVLEAIDKAGNAWSKKMSVIFDPIPPKILSISPEEGSTVRADAPIIEIDFEENCEIASIDLWVNGQKTDYGLDPNGTVLKSEPLPLGNGEHEVRVEIVDVAGNKAGRKWSFELNSTRLVLDISERCLYLYEGGMVTKTYRVAVGTPRYPTPLGTYKITSKRKNPTWYNPHKTWSKDMPPFIPPGPGNPLGPRALNLSASGIRIHGTPQVWSIGRAASHGCIRMRPSDVIDLYPRVSVGAPIDIIM